jgi:hypothetical protein
MSRFRVSELDPRLVNLEVWPSVAEDAIKDSRLLEQYQMRKNAMKLLILGASRREITEATGIDRVSIIHLFKRRITSLAAASAARLKSVSSGS